MHPDDSPMYTDEVHVQLLVYDVGTSIDRVRQVTKSFPHIVKGELPILREAADKLAELIAALSDQS